MLAPSKTGKLPPTEFNATYEAGSGAQTGVSGVQLLGKPARPPTAQGPTGTECLAGQHEETARAALAQIFLKGDRCRQPRRNGTADSKSAGVRWIVLLAESFVNFLYTF